MFTVKNFYRILISLGSVAGFVFGWAFLAHAPKPAQAPGQPTAVLGLESDLAPLPTLQPLNFDSPSPAQQVNPVFQQPRFSVPVLRSGGS